MPTRGMSSPTSSNPALLVLWTASATSNSSSPRVDRAPWLISRALLTWLDSERQETQILSLPPRMISVWANLGSEKPGKEENS